MRHLLLGAMLVALPLHAAQLCDSGSCQFELEFSAGGAITTGSGATLNFNNFGAVVLGQDGSIDLGEGGSITPDPGEGPPNFNNSGTLVLGPGGSINFGSGGSLTTAGGNIEFVDGGDFAVTGASTASVESDSNIRLGTLTSSGEVTVVAGRSVDTGGAISFDISNANDDANATIYVESGRNVSVGAFNAANVQVFEDVPQEGSGGTGGFGNGVEPGGSFLQAEPSTGALGVDWLLMGLLGAALAAMRRPAVRMAAPIPSGFPRAPTPCGPTPRTLPRAMPSCGPPLPPSVPARKRISS